jgi:pimeloyl-ACP methyl ester carboxylesterase
LWASYLHRDHKARAAEEFAAVREDGQQLPEPSASFLRYLSDRDVARLGSRLLAYIGDYGNEPALSPSRSPRPTAPVFLLHGRDDTVIPAVESQLLADHVRGETAVKVLLTDLISHAETVQPKQIMQVFTLIEFWRSVLDSSAS